VYHNHHPKLTL